MCEHSGSERPGCVLPSFVILERNSGANEKNSAALALLETRGICVSWCADPDFCGVRRFRSIERRFCSRSSFISGGARFNSGFSCLGLCGAVLGEFDSRDFESIDRLNASSVFFGESTSPAVSRNPLSAFLLIFLS